MRKTLILCIVLFFVSLISVFPAYATSSITVQNSEQGGGGITIRNNGTVTYQSTPVPPQTIVVTVVVTATPIPTSTPQVYHAYKSYKTIGVQVTPTASPVPTVRVIPTKSVRHSQAVVTPKPSPITAISDTIKSILHFLSFGLLL